MLASPENSRSKASAGDLNVELKYLRMEGKTKVKNRQGESIALLSQINDVQVHAMSDLMVFHYGLGTSDSAIAAYWSHCN